MKKIKENPKVKLFLELWSNKRYRAFLSLGLYIIFFTFLGILFRTVPQSTINNDNDVKQEVQKINVVDELSKKVSDNYNYDFVINDDTLLQISCTSGSCSFTYDANDYIIIYENVYRKEEGNLLLIDAFMDMVVPLGKLSLNNILNNISIENKKLETDDYVIYNLPVSSLKLENLTGFMEFKFMNDSNKIEITYESDKYMLEIKE